MGSSSSKSFTLKQTAEAASSQPKRKGGAPEENKMSNNDEYVEEIVCHESDLKENEMKAFNLGGEYTKVLVVRQNGDFTAVGSNCTHYGAPLEKGALGVGRVRCPWHGACFNTTTGDIEDYPGLDSLPCYQVTVCDGNVKVRAKKSDLTANRRVVSTEGRCGRDNSVYLVVGGGPAAASCVETLRSNACRGRVIMVAKENALPYDRIKVSKSLNSEAEKLQFRNAEFYRKNDIEVLKGVHAISLDSVHRTVTLSNGDCINFAAVFLATGSSARILPIPGHNLRNVFTLRSTADGAAIYASLAGNDKDVVILGASFIGMEVAAYCVNKAKSVTVISRDDVPFLPVFGHAIGSSIKKFFETKGVNFITRNNIKRCIGDGGKLKALELDDASTIPADILLMGVGTTFNTEFLANSGINMQANGSINVNNKLETNIRDVYAGGDIAYAPVYAHNNEPAAIGHIGLAHYHGKIAALNMLGKYTPLKAVPFFWTTLFNKSIRYCGYGRFTDLQIVGDVDTLEFAAYFFDESGHVISMASCQKDPIVSKFAELLAQGKSLHKNELARDPLAWTNNYLD